MSNRSGTSAGDWSEGYVIDTLYTDNVYREQSPVWLNYVATVMGCRPRPLDQSFSYLELGCGLGHSIAIFAAAFPKGRFVGVDFNPAHIDFAQRRAAMLGLDNLIFREASFQDIAADAAGRGPARDLDEFDFVALHGIYSWVSIDGRRAIQRILFERLRPGGLVYNSYNCLPGWQIDAPLQRLMKELSTNDGGNSERRLRSSLNWIKKLAATRSGYFGVNAQAAHSLELLSEKPDRYLAHEFMNGDWNAFYSADVVDEMSAAKLDYVGSATLTENHPDLILTKAEQSTVNDQPNERHRQLIQDFLTNQKFRRDIYVRGHARLTPAETAAQRAHQYLVAPRPLEGLDPQIKVGRGTISIEPERFKNLINTVSGPANSEGAFAAAFAKVNQDGGGISRLLAILTSAQHLMPAVAAQTKLVRPHRTNGQMPAYFVPLKANGFELHAAIAAKRTAILSSPVTGNAVILHLNEALFLEAMLQSKGSLSEMVSITQREMSKRNLRPRKDGKTLVEPTDVASHLRTQADTFIAQELPNLVRLGVVAAP